MNPCFIALATFGGRYLCACASGAQFCGCCCVVLFVVWIIAEIHAGSTGVSMARLGSVWWDDVINGVREWIPSNYCQIILSLDAVLWGREYGEAWVGAD